MRRADIASGSVLLIGSLYMILFGIPAQIDAVENATISPRTLPYVCAVAVAALSAILVLMRLRTPAEEGEGGSPLTLGHMVWSGIILGSVLLGLLLLGPAGPLIARTSGCASRITSARLPRQPVTMTLPFSAIASPIASSDSSTAESMKPQVLTTTTSASS